MGTVHSTWVSGSIRAGCQGRKLKRSPASWLVSGHFPGRNTDHNVVFKWELEMDLTPQHFAAGKFDKRPSANSFSDMAGQSLNCFGFLCFWLCVRSLCDAPDCPGVLTWHTLTARRGGIWKAELSGINEGSAVDFFRSTVPACQHSRLFRDSLLRATTSALPWGHVLISTLHTPLLW